MVFKRGRKVYHNFFSKNRKGQMTIFIILAIFIVTVVALFFIFKDRIIKSPINSDVEPVYNTFTTCLKEDLKLGIGVIETEGGYIYLPSYNAGSEYMPFSSQLNFLDNPIPYWYYVSGNNIERTQVPSKEDMQKQLQTFVESKARNCFFDNYYSQGYNIVMKDPHAKVTIEDNKVNLDLTMDFAVTKGEESYVAKNHNIVVDSELGSLYNSAIQVYNKEQQDLFLEKYGIDILRLYAPVDGVELSCVPKVWDANKVFADLREAIVQNTLELRNSNKKGDYFDIKIPEIPSKQKVRFLNSENWTYTFEVDPSSGPIMTANSVGNQQGLGILGFCYVPYHFVYSMKYPVLVQISSGNAAGEIFQFPLAIVIEKNEPRNTSNVSEGQEVNLGVEELCKDKNTVMNISIYNSNLRPVDAYISYECFGSTCDIGATKNGKLSEEFPQCVNGFINVKADGYKDEHIMYSTVQEGALSIYLSRMYNLSVQLKLDKQNYNGNAVIYFISDDISSTVFYPQQKSVQLAEGKYEVQVYIYKNSSLKIDSTTQQQCINVPRSSIGGILGLTKKECYNVQVPEQMITNAPSGGGKVNYTFSDDELKNSKTINIFAKSLPNPTTLNQIQTNYILFEENPPEINLT